MLLHYTFSVIIQFSVLVLHCALRIYNFEMGCVPTQSLDFGAALAANCQEAKSRLTVWQESPTVPLEPAEVAFRFSVGPSS